MNTSGMIFRVAFFTGSFDPFTVGHDDIVRRALPLFDRLVIGIGVNERKQYMTPTEERVAHISNLYSGEPKVEALSYSDLTVDFIRRYVSRLAEDGILPSSSAVVPFIIKGVRSMKDYEYERDQADVNLRIGGVETLFLFADPCHSAVSSSMVRELIHFGKDVSEYLPKVKDKEAFG